MVKQRNGNVTTLRPDGQVDGHPQQNGATAHSSICQEKDERKVARKVADKHFQEKKTSLKLRARRKQPRGGQASGNESLPLLNSSSAEHGG